jgi:hypothetical protein
MPDLPWSRNIAEDLFGVHGVLLPSLAGYLARAAMKPPPATINVANAARQDSSPSPEAIRSRVEATGTA